MKEQFKGCRTEVYQGECQNMKRITTTVSGEPTTLYDPLKLYARDVRQSHVGLRPRVALPVASPRSHRDKLLKGQVELEVSISRKFC